MVLTQGQVSFQTHHAAWQWAKQGDRSLCAAAKPTHSENCYHLLAMAMAAPSFDKP